MRGKRLLALVGAICLVLVLVLMPVVSGCARAPSPGELPPVKIGAVVWTTGVAKDLGDASFNAMMVAEKEINESGGILGGRKIEILRYDEGYSAETAITSAKKAINDGCVAIAGGNDATTIVSIKDVCSESGIPMAGLGAGAEITKDPNAYYGLIKCSPTARQIVPAQARWVEDMGYRTVVHVAVDSEFCYSVDDILREYWDRPGSPVELLDTIYFPYGEAEAAVEFTKAAGMHPDFILGDIWGEPLIVSSLIRLHEVGYEGGLQGACWNAMTDAIIEAAGEAAEGALAAHHWVPDPSVQTNWEFATAYEEMFGTMPDGLEEIAYESIMILALGIDNAGTDSDLEAIAQGIHTVDWTSPRGVKVEFMSDGMEFVPFWIYGQVQNGKFVPAYQLTMEEKDYE